MFISHENNKCTKSHKNQVCIQITSVVQQDDHGGMKKMKLSSSLLPSTMLLIKINIQCTCTYMQIQIALFCYVILPELHTFSLLGK